MLRIIVLSVVCALLAGAGCQSETRYRTKECGTYFSYGKTYASTLEGKQGDTEWTDEFDIVVQQNGPAGLLANILGVVDAEGISFGHSFQAFDYWVSDSETVTYSGGSRPGEPYTIDLTIDVDYDNIDYDYSIEYVIYLGDPVDYFAPGVQRPLLVSLPYDRD